MPRLRIGAFSLYYAVHGEGRPLVFLHGAGGNHLSWWQQVPTFARRYRCVIPDQRAFGLSPDVPNGPGRQAFGSDLLTLLDHLGLESVAVVAHSMGGRAAARLLLSQPQRVAAAVFSGTTAGVLTDESRRLQDEHRQRTADQPLSARALSRRFAHRHPEAAFLWRAVRDLNPPRPRGFLAPVPGYTGSTRDAFAESGVPMLFIVGQEDQVVPAAVVRLAARALPNAELHVVPGAGHSAYFEEPAAFNALVLEFLERHYPSARAS